jgi:hypothetical protein
MPYPSAKGLTFDTVLMPRLIPGLFGKVDSGRLERWLFVGVTRATQWVYLSAINNHDVLFIERFKALEAEKQLSIKLSKDLFSGAGLSRAGDAENPVDARDDDGDLADIF